jgi:hypothetical protein
VSGRPEPWFLCRVRGQSGCERSLNASASVQGGCCRRLIISAWKPRDEAALPGSPTTDFKKGAKAAVVGYTFKAPYCPANFFGMGIVKDAILSVVISIAAVGAAEGLGWVWYILGLLVLGR